MFFSFQAQPLNDSNILTASIRSVFLKCCNSLNINILLGLKHALSAQFLPLSLAFSAHENKNYRKLKLKLDP